MEHSPAISERAVVFLIGAIQLINVLEFMMVMPLGPDFAKALSIESHHLGLISGSYTAASAIAGLLASTVIERFDRRKALAFCMSGLILATFAAGLSQNFSSLLVARVLAGIFGGPSSSLSLAVITDIIPLERRGRAMGAIMSTFAIASVFGVPAGLELSRLGNWRVPFFFIGIFGIIVVTLAILKLPPMVSHMEALARDRHRQSLSRMLMRGPVFMALLSCALMMVSGFLLVPNLAPYIQNNLYFPRERLGLLYFLGGSLSFFSMRSVGYLTDRIGAMRIAWGATLIFILTVILGFMTATPPVSVIVIFSLFMVSLSTRGVAFNTLSSQVPGASERASYMSVQSSVQHLASALGAVLSSHILVEGKEHQLLNMPLVAALAIGAAGLMPVCLTLLDRQLRHAAKFSRS